MIGTATIIAIIKTTGSIAAFGSAYIKLVEAERTKQFEVTRELGTLSVQITNAKMTGDEYTHLQAQREHLLSLTVKKGTS